MLQDSLLNKCSEVYICAYAHTHAHTRELTKAWKGGPASHQDSELAGQWWCTPLIPALGKQRQVDLCEFEASLVYRASSRTARAIQRNPVSKKQNKANNNKKKQQVNK